MSNESSTPEQSSAISSSNGNNNEPNLKFSTQDSTLKNLFQEEGFISITTDEQVVKKVLKEGQGEIVPLKSTCVVFYDGRLLPSKQPFDLCYSINEKKSEFSFQVGEGQVIQAFDEAVLTMKKGEVALIRTSPSHAFGRLGCPPRIPPNCCLEYEIELKSFEREYEEIKVESLASKIEKVQKIKEEGNDFFKQANYKKATRFYNRALSHFNGLREEETEAVVNLKVSLYLNLAFCNLKLDEISKAIKNSEKAIELKSDNAKAYYRLGQAFAASDNLSLAKENFLKSAKLDPQNREIRNELENINKRIQQQKELNKKPELFSGIFNQKIK